MTQEDFFYVDSDIIFREMIDFDKLNFHEKLYMASDASGYLSATYLQQKSDFYVDEMAAVVGITPAQALELQTKSGGAQWILSKPSLAFWQKIYHDCEALYRYFLLAEFMLRKAGALPQENERLQKWCADMWAILWNTKYFGLMLNCLESWISVGRHNPWNHGTIVKFCIMRGSRTSFRIECFTKHVYQFNTVYR